MMDSASLDPISNDQAVKRTELIQLWAEVDGFLQLTSGGTRPSDPLTLADDAQAAAKARFASLFAEEIQVVGAARNLVAHARPIDDTLLDEAVELARELVRIIREGQGVISSPPAASSSG
jgi:hypothetical protein